MSKGKLICAMLAALAALLVLVLVVRGRPSPLGRGAGPIPTVCAACGHSESRQPSSLPDTCAKCGKREVWPAATCPKCRTAVPLRVSGGPQQRQSTLVCPRCGQRFAPALAPAARDDAAAGQ